MVFPVVGGTQSTGYEISNSARFGGVETFLTKSQSDSESDTDRRKFTVSGWYKQTLQGSAGGWNGLWSAMANSSNFTSLKINGDEKLIFDLNVSGTNKSFTCDGVFRDPSAWYHIVVAYDSTDGTAANRLKIYVNGEQRTGTFSADLSQNVSAHWGDDASAARVGAYGNNTGNAYMYNGYMADVCMTVGYALAPTAFGKTDNNGVWIPKNPSITYSANGFFLEFQQTGTSQNSSGIGADTSGNDNHFAIDSNNTQLDSTTDTPTNNFATLNPLSEISTSVTFSEGNTKASIGGGGTGNTNRVVGNMGFTSGKWYYEVKYVSTSASASYLEVGFVNTNISMRYHVRGSDGERWDNGSSSSSTSYRHDPGDIIGVYIDADNKKWYIQVNGSNEDVGNGVADVSAGTGFVHQNFAVTDFILPYFGNASTGGGHVFEVNFGNAPFSISSSNADANGIGSFEYNPTNDGVDFHALCTKNLAEFG